VARVKGARDADFDQKRTALIARLTGRLAAANAEHPSFRQLAEAAGVSQTTLRHYFGDLPGLITAVIAWHGSEGQPYQRRLAQPSGAFAESIAAAVRFIAAGQRQAQVRALHVIGASEGMRRHGVGETYRTAVLDPVLAALRQRLDAHVAAGEMRPCDTRVAATFLCAPILLAFQHQADIGGAETDPLDMDAFTTEIAEAFVRAYGRPAG